MSDPVHVWDYYVQRDDNGKIIASATSRLDDTYSEQPIPDNDPEYLEFMATRIRPPEATPHGG